MFKYPLNITESSKPEEGIVRWERNHRTALDMALSFGSASAW